MESTKKSLQLVDQYSIELVRPATYINACEAYLFNQNYEKALKIALKALDSDFAKSNLYIEKSIQGTLYNAYKATDQHKNALIAYEKYVALNDSISSQDRQLEVSRKELAFEAEKKELVAQAEIERQKHEKNIFISSGSIFFLLMTAGFVLYRQKQQGKQKVREAGFKLRLTESKLTALRAQLNPHFIFNALNAIEAYVSVEDSKKASEYLIKFSTLMRTILNNSEKNWISLEEELDLMKLYIDIEGIRMKHKLDYTIEVGKDMEASNVLVPSLFLQPFIENSIEHGIAPKNSEGKIKVSIERQDNELICIVADDGYGIKTSENPNSKGLYIAKSRIEYINQITNNNSHFEIINQEPGVKVTVRIPYKTEF